MDKLKLYGAPDWELYAEEYGWYLEDHCKCDVSDDCGHMSYKKFERQMNYRFDELKSYWENCTDINAQCEEVM